MVIDERRLVFIRRAHFSGDAMAQRAAVGNGPVAYFTDDGQRVLVPLSEIYFDGDAIKTRTAASAPSSLDNWLKYLVAQRRLVPGAAPAPGSAMVLTAAAPGSTGNSIVVTVTPNGTNVDITVTETNKYTGLSLADLPTVLGVAGATAPGSKPGLVRVVSSTGAAVDPAEVAADPVTPVAGVLPRWTIEGSTAGTTSFTLEARGPGSDLGTMTISVADVVGPAGAKRFTLNVKWTSTITAVTVSDLAVPITDAASKPRRLAFAVLISEPAGGGGYALPRPGTVTLRGGTPPLPATQAKATLLAANT
jgi:hypothetical protein